MTADGVPRELAGWWAADDGKAVLLEHHLDRLVVTVCPQVGATPYRSARLLVRRKPIRRLSSAWIVDVDQRRCLQVEAGMLGLGPTYRLYPAVETDEGELRPAPADAAPEQLVLVPATSIGLYDDWDDDVGVAWAYPLKPFRRVAGA